MIRPLAVCAAIALALAAACGGAQPTTPTPIVVTPEPPPAPPPPPPPPPVLGITRVLAFGDSMTYGVLSAPLPSLSLTAGIAESYPFKLKALLDARYTDQQFAVSNAGYPGKKAVEDLGRLNDEMSAAKPQVLLLLEGANDMAGLVGLSSAAVSTGITTTVNALEDMVRDARFRGIDVLIATLPPQRAGGRPNRGDAAPLIPRLNDAIKIMAGKKQAQVVDLYNQVPLSLVGEDGLHLTEAGNQKIAEIFLDAIKTKYEKAAGTLDR